MQNTNDYLNSENTERFKLQAPSLKPKPQASSTKLQASSLKDLFKRFLNPDPRIGDKESRFKAPSAKLHGSWNKFHGPLIMGPDQDKCIHWMSLMEGNLMWREFDFVPLYDFQFNSEKFMILIIPQHIWHANNAKIFNTIPHNGTRFFL